MNTSNFVNSLRNAHQEVSSSRNKADLRADQFSLSKSSRQGSNGSQKSFDGNIVEESDPYFPGIRLVNRYVSREELHNSIPPHTDCLTLTELFKQVYPPDFKRPSNSEANFTVFAIVATRSQAKSSAQGNKYVTMTLSDLKYDITIALHGKAHETHWKIQPGTLIAIFNPQFWISKIDNNRTLNLSVNKANCIIEVGQASDLGQCEAMTAASNNSKRCKNWVDVRKTHFCDFHVEQKMMQTKRPELNSLNAKLWDPKQIGKYHGSKMAVVQGGEVKWKRGLQVDSQAPKFKMGGAVESAYGGLPDAPIGRVFSNENSRTLRMNSGRYERSLAEQERQKLKDKRSLERATADAELNTKLNLQLNKQSSTNKPTKTTDKVVKPNRVVKPASKTQVELRKLGFAPKLGTRSSSHISPPIQIPALRKNPSQETQAEDSDSDLEIV